MKYFLLALLFCFQSCSSSGSSSASAFEQWASEDKKIRVLSTTAMIDDLVASIGGHYVAHLPLICGQVDPHSYELVKGDDEKLSLAHLIFSNGLGLEHGASLRYHLHQHAQTVALGDWVYQHYPERVLTVGLQIDPHIWMDMSLWAKAITPIVDALSRIDPEHASFYSERGAALKEQMENVDKDLIDAFSAVSAEKRFLVTSHDAFHYFARRYLAFSEEGSWKERCAAPEGLAPEGQLSVFDLQEMVNYLRRHRVQTVFPESNVSQDSLKKIVRTSREKGWEATIASDALYGDAMGPVGSDADSYLKMMEHNAHVLLKAWR